MTSTLKDHLARGGLINAPGVFELISALVADRMGFPALYVTGYGTVASHLGLPDAGIATYTDMLGRIATICARTSTPVIADADTGYGGLLNVHHTVQGYEAAGVAAIQIEDQEFPKKCGHTPHRRVIPAEDMARKIEVAVAARKGDMLIIARTDARTGWAWTRPCAARSSTARRGPTSCSSKAPRPRPRWPGSAPSSTCR